MSRSLRFLACGFLPVLVTAAASSLAAGQNWPQLYDPLYVATLNLTMSEQDWNTVRHDLTFTMEVPAQLSMPGESPLLVGVRRKSGPALPSESDPQKVALKIDINEFVEQSWHAVKKLSLENGAETSTLLEGFAWYLHRLARTSGVYPYMPGLACWVKLYVNGQYYGCYVHVEQVDKRFLENRGLWLSDDTWLYKQDQPDSPTIEFGPLTHSPTYDALCYSPFRQSCPTPPPGTLAVELADLIDMQGMLTLGAVNAWCFSPDNLFSRGKNLFFSDSRYRKRLYFTWDLDGNFGDLNASESIYELGDSPYEDIILDNPTFRAQYNTIMRTLLNDAFTTSNLTAAINNLESLLLPILSADPYNPVSASDFSNLRNFVGARNANVASQLPAGVAVDGEAPERSALLSAHPNPFQTRTQIRFHLDRSAAVRIGVHDARGARVRTLVDGHRDAGSHAADWNGTDDRGRRLGPGIYFLTYETDGRSWSRKVALIR